MKKSIKKSKHLKVAEKTKRANSRRLGLLKKIKIREERETLANKEIKIPINFAIPIRISHKKTGVAWRYAKKWKEAVFWKNSVVKIVSILLIIALNWFGIKSIGNTSAYFNDTEASAGNTFAAAKLDFSLNFLMSDGFRTQTQGGWGAKAHGNNPGSYRDDHFSDAFVGGLIIGGEASGYYAHFAGSADIENFLPEGGTANHFSGPHENPDETEAGVLAGQTAALALNIGFDNSDPDFSANEGKLADFHANATGSPCENMTAGEVLDEANSILSGKSSGLTPSEISGCAAEINERFDNGERTKITPSKYVEREITINKFEGLNFKHILKIEEMSGNAELCSALTVKAYLNGTLAYLGNLLSFNYEPSVFSDSANKWRLQIGLPEDASSSAKKKTCGLKYIVSGWQENITNFGEGFSDTEEISDSADSGEWDSSAEEDSDDKDNEDDSDSKIIVINEFLPNPIGDDYASKPNGEWVELYNNSGSDVDVDGWYLYDSAGHPLEISRYNSDSNGDIADGGETIIPAHKWLVVYLDGKHKPGWLNNAEDDSIRLFNGPKPGGHLIDSYYYEVDGTIAENKSYARIPDGTGAWVDPVPTPGKTNIVSENIDPASAIAVENIPAGDINNTGAESGAEGLLSGGRDGLNADITGGNIFNLSSGGSSSDNMGICALNDNIVLGINADSVPVNNNTADTAICADNMDTVIEDVVSGVNADSSIINDTVNDAINNPVDSAVDNSVDFAASAGAEDVSGSSANVSDAVNAEANSNEPFAGTETVSETTDVLPPMQAEEQASPEQQNSDPYADASAETRQENPPAVEEEPPVIEEPSASEDAAPQSSDTSTSANDNPNNTQSDAVQN